MYRCIFVYFENYHLIFKFSPAFVNGNYTSTAVFSIDQKMARSSSKHCSLKCSCTKIVNSQSQTETKISDQ